MKKVSIIGLFCTDRKIADGQSIKTRIIANEIGKSIGAENINKIDTYGWKKNPIKLFVRCINAVRNSSNVVFLTDAGGIKVFPWLLTSVNVFKKIPIHYVVIGGWLIHFVEKHKVLSAFLKKLSGIFVETQVMKHTLEGFGFKNVYLMPNVKELTPLVESELVYFSEEPYRFCIFSRIMREKGVENAINAIDGINALYGRKICTLDLYGQVDKHQVEWFEQLTKTFSDAVQYKGIVPFDQSVSVLKDYYALLFPTQFYTEGIPGTLIDAYAAGIPVIASEWESVADIVVPDETGVTYPFENPEALQACIIHLIENPKKVFKMKKCCLKKVEQYLPDVVMEVLLSKFD